MDAAAAAQPVPWPDAPTQVTDLETVGVWYVRVRVAGVRVRVAGVRVRVTGGGGSPRKNLIRMDLMTDGFWGPLGKFLTFPGCPLSR